MTLAVAASTASVASGSVSGADLVATPSVPDGAVGDLIVWIVGWGTPTATSISDRPVLSGGLSASAVHRGSAFGGGGTYGTDVGPRGLSHWSALASSATGATDNITFTSTGTPSDTTRTMGAVAVRISRDAAKVLSYAFTSGTDTNAADSWAPAGFTDVGATTGDLVLASIAGVPDTINPTTTVAWPGCTLGTQATVRSGAVTTGEDLRMAIRSMLVTAGSSSGAPSAPSATTGLNGVQGILRIREATAPANNSGAFLALL